MKGMILLLALCSTAAHASKTTFELVDTYAVDDTVYTHISFYAPDAREEVFPVTARLEEQEHDTIVESTTLDGSCEQRGPHNLTCNMRNNDSAFTVKIQTGLNARGIITTSEMQQHRLVLP